MFREQNTSNDEARPYVVLIGGTLGIGSRITGSIPKKLSQDDLARLRSTVARGSAIEVVTASRESWLAMRSNLLAQIGGGGK